MRRPLGRRPHPLAVIAVVLVAFLLFGWIFKLAIKVLIIGIIVFVVLSVLGLIRR